MSEDILAKLRTAIPTAQNGQKTILQEAGLAIKAQDERIAALAARVAELEAEFASAPLPEAAGSINLRMVDPETGATPQFTFRYHSDRKAVAAWPGIKADLASLGLVGEEEYQERRRSERVAAPTQGQPIPTGQGMTPPPAHNGELSFEAKTLSGSMNDGKTYWKVKGTGKFGKFGVTIWKEALEEAGFGFDSLNPATIYDLTGWTAHYENNEEGKPKKVTRLSK